jgi:hypothetical protein
MPLIPGTSYLATFILSMRDETQRDVARSVSKTIEDDDDDEDEDDWEQRWYASS